MMKKIIKGIYKSIPFKKRIFTSIRSFWPPPESVYRHLHFTGIITIPVDATHSFKIKHFGYQVENDLFWAGIEGRWERNTIGTWIKLASRANVIFDIGANTGVYSLIAQSLNEKAQIFAFEPVKRVYQKLVLNNKLNGYTINCIEKALSNTIGTALIYDNESDHEYGASLNKQQAEHFATQATEIQIDTLDHFIDERKISRVDLMKIDVEHHEPEVLQGFKKYLERYKPDMLIEVLTDETGLKIMELTAGLGYLYFHINEEKGLKKTDDILKREGYNYLLCKEETAKFLQLV